MRKSLLRLSTTLGVVGVIVSAVASIGRVLSKIKETPVSFVSNRLHFPTQKIASAVVGIGLFTAPFESAQAQVLSPSHVIGVQLWSTEVGVYFIVVDFHAFDTSSDYVVMAVWPDGIEVAFSFWNRAYPVLGWSFLNPLAFGDYHECRFYRDDVGSSDWIDVDIWVGLDGSASAWVTDSDGRSYSIDVTTNLLY